MNTRKKLVGTIAVGAALLVVPIAQARHGDDLDRTARRGNRQHVASSGVDPTIGPDFAADDAARSSDDGPFAGR